MHVIYRQLHVLREQYARLTLLNSRKNKHQVNQNQNNLSHTKKPTQPVGSVSSEHQSIHQAAQGDEKSEKKLEKHQQDEHENENDEITPAVVDPSLSQIERDNPDNPDDPANPADSAKAQTTGFKIHQNQIIFKNPPLLDDDDDPNNPNKPHGAAAVDLTDCIPTRTNHSSHKNIQSHNNHSNGVKGTVTNSRERELITHCTSLSLFLPLSFFFFLSLSTICASTMIVTRILSLDYRYRYI